MEKGFNLSDKEFRIDFPALKLTMHDSLYRGKNVKKFIKLLKEEIKRQADNLLQKHNLSIEEWKFELPLINKINQLAGDKLNERI